MDFKEKVYLDSGRADARRLIPLASVELAEQHINALLGFHAFAGNDYVSSFFTKEKKTCWKKFTLWNLHSWVRTNEMNTNIENLIFIYLYVYHFYDNYQRDKFFRR